MTLHYYDFNIFRSEINYHKLYKFSSYILENTPRCYYVDQGVHENSNTLWTNMHVQSL